jgi:hypothetical protein
MKQRTTAAKIRFILFGFGFGFGIINNVIIIRKILSATVTEFSRKKNLTNQLISKIEKLNLKNYLSRWNCMRIIQ